MKKVILALVLLASAQSFAGPEEHVQAQTCYYLNPAQAGQASNKIPTQICVETIQVNPDQNTVEIYSYFMQDLYLKPKVDYVTRKNEDVYSFKVTSNLLNSVMPACGSADKIDLVVTGQSDNYGYVNTSYLQITVMQSASDDTCHSPRTDSVFTYSTTY